MHQGTFHKPSTTKFFWGSFRFGHSHWGDLSASSAISDSDPPRHSWVVGNQSQWSQSPPQRHDCCKCSGADQQVVEILLKFHWIFNCVIVSKWESNVSISHHPTHNTSENSAIELITRKHNSNESFQNSCLQVCNTKAPWGLPAQYRTAHLYNAGCLGPQSSKIALSSWVLQCCRTQTTFDQTAKLKWEAKRHIHTSGDLQASSEKLMIMQSKAFRSEQPLAKWPQGNNIAVDSRSISLRQMACSVWWRCPCLGRQSAGRSCSWGMWYLDPREANLNWLLFEFENGWTCFLWGDQFHAWEICSPVFFASLLPLRASKTSCALPTSWNSGWIHAAPLWRTWCSSPWECHRFKEHQTILPFRNWRK